MRRLVVDEITLERGNLVLAKQRRERPAPQVPEQIEVGLRVFAERAVDGGVERVEQRPAAEIAALDAHRQEAPFLVHRDAAVKDQVIIAHQVHRALAFEVTHLFPERLALEKRGLELRHAFLFLG